MITIKSGDVLTSDAQLIVHQVNCRGVMGAGLAKQIKQKYNHVYIEYKAVASREMLGRILAVPINDRQYIINAFAQDGYGRFGVHTSYDAFASCMQKIKGAAEAFGCKVKIAMPYMIGCGLAGGDWETIQEILKSTFGDSENIEVELYKLN